MPEDNVVGALAVDPARPWTLYAGTYSEDNDISSGGVFQSTDGAASWHPINAGLPADVGVKALAIAATTPATLYAGTDSFGVFAMQPVAACVGDCSGDQTVTVDELLTLVSIALGTQPASACPGGLAPGTAVDVALIIQAVNNALSGCSG